MSRRLTTTLDDSPVLSRNCKCQSGISSDRHPDHPQVTACWPIETQISLRKILTKTGHNLLIHPLESLCDSFFVFYSLWTLTWLASYLANLSFSSLSPIFLLLLPLSVLALAFKPRPLMDQGTLSCARRDMLCVLLFIIAGVLLTLFLHRPDADDEQYLGEAFSLLANADEPIRQLAGYPGFHASGLSDISAYEPFRAMVSYITGLPLLDSYYLLVPAIMSALTVIITYRLLRELIPEGWFIAMLFFFVVMLTWGDVHRTLANFGFVRMFQGKSVLVSTVVPALFLYFLLRERGQAAYHGFLVGAVLITGVGFTRGGLIIGPLLVLLLTLAKCSKKVLIVAGILGAVILPFIYYSGWNLMNPSGLVMKSGCDCPSTTNLEMLEFTIGTGFRGVFLLMCVAASFLFVSNEHLRSYRNFLAIFFLLLLIPGTSNFFAKTIQEYLSWRWMWIMPVPALASVAVGGAFARIRAVSHTAVALSVFAALAAAFTAAGPRRVVSGENYTSIRWPDAKLDGDSVYLRPYQKTAVIKDGKLYLDGYEKGF
jgi:hypothetical protein